METVPREVTKVDYYAIEHLRQYIPQITPQTTIETIPVERIVQRTEYIPVERKIVHYPETPLAVEYQNKINQGISVGNIGRVVSTGATYVQQPSTTYVSGPVSGSLVGGTLVSGGQVVGGTYLTGGSTVGGTYLTGGSTVGGTYVTGGNTIGGTYLTGGNTIGGTYLTGGNTIGGTTYVTSPGTEYVTYESVQPGTVTYETVGNVGTVVGGTRYI